MPEPVTVAEAQEKLLETTFGLQRIIQRLHQQHQEMKASFEGVASYYEADEPGKDRPTLELALAEEIYNAYHSLEDANECLVIACRLTDRMLRERWRLKARR